MQSAIIAEGILTAWRTIRRDILAGLLSGGMWAGPGDTDIEPRLVCELVDALIDELYNTAE